MALHLTCGLLLAQADGVLEVARAVPPAQGGAFERERRFDDLALRVGRVALVLELNLEAGQFSHLPGDLLEALLHVLPNVLSDGDVAALDLDLHPDLPLVGPSALISGGNR